MLRHNIISTQPSRKRWRPHKFLPIALVNPVTKGSSASAVTVHRVAVEFPNLRFGGATQGLLGSNGTLAFQNLNHAKAS